MSKSDIDPVDDEELLFDPDPSLLSSELVSGITALYISKLRHDISHLTEFSDHP